MDVAGNVGELCADAKASFRLVRGGGWQELWQHAVVLWIMAIVALQAGLVELVKAS